MNRDQFIDHLTGAGFLLEFQTEGLDLMMTAEREINFMPLTLYLRVPTQPESCHRRALNSFNGLIWDTIAAYFAVGRA